MGTTAFRLLYRILPALLLAACGQLEPPGKHQPLIVALPADPAFHQDEPVNEEMDGFSRDLTRAFAETLGVEVTYITTADYPAVVSLLNKGKAHLAAGLPIQSGHDGLHFTPPVLESRQLVVQHGDALPVDSLAKLAGREIASMPGAPQVAALRMLKLDPPPQPVEAKAADELAMLEDVAHHRHALAATDELHFSIAANYFPDLTIAVDLPQKNAYAWAVAPRQTAVHERAAEFIEASRQNGTLRRLTDRYFGHIHRLDTRDIEVFFEHVRMRLPDYRHFFHEAQEITGIDWRLIAALAYQESKWDPLATSPTGVRGMMMLTEDTADRLRVSNRLDARQSIIAGAKYLAYLMDELTDDIRHPDRLWFALAAYNLGMGHLGGARHFAPGLKRDPNLWVDMKQVLPLMARPEFYKRLKSGRARGGEAVIMVENIRNYFDVLSRFEPAHRAAKAPQKKVAAKKKPPKRSARR